MSDLFVSQLGELCRAQVTRAKWVFVPSHAVGRTLGERIALNGTNWLNLRFVTPLDIALRMGAPFLVERGTDPSEEGLGPALMMRLLLDLPEEGGYFRPLADQPTMAQALWSTIRELRMAGVKSRDFRPDAFESAAKHRELQGLLAAYEQFLSANNRGDMAMVYEEALLHRHWCPIQPGDCWTELPDTVWSPLQRQLIDAMPGERIVPRAIEVVGAAIPRRVAAIHVERLSPEPDGAPLAFVLAPLDGHPNRAIDLFHAGSRHAEIDEVFRRILGTGASLDQVEIACASDAHVALVWEKALRHEWPVTLGPGIPALVTRPGRALVGLCDWIETDFSAGHLRRLLQSGDMGIEREDEGFTASEAARTLARAEAAWGRATYDLALGILQKSHETRAKDPDASDDERSAANHRAAQTRLVRAWITTLISSIPEPANDGKVSLQPVADAVLAFVDRSTSRVNQLDYRSADALADYIRELRAVGAVRCSLSEALRFIRERVESLDVAPDRPRPGHLFTSRLAQAGLAGRPFLFVVGLEEGRVFPAASEDPVLLDAERLALSPALKRSSDKIDEAVWTVLTRLVSFRGKSARVCFSYSCRDTREFRETYASWLMLQAFRLQQGDATRSYQHMKAALGEPVSSVPRRREAAASDAEWWLRTVVGVGPRGTTVVENAFPSIKRGRHAERSRGSSDFTEFDGHVPAAGPLLDPCAPANVYSVTDLEAAAACPYRFFLKRGLGLRPVDEKQRDKDVWLDPLTRGSELHDVYAALLRRCRDARRRPDVQKDGAWLKTFAEAALLRLNREMPPATEEILERETKEFLADVELFLEEECEPSTCEPIGFEVSFGRPLRDDDENLAREDPVEIDLGGGRAVRIAGRIDRIDKVGPAAFRIVDYKTGGFWRSDWQGTFNGGRRLQHALYGLAAIELLRGRYRNPKVTTALYYFPSQKGGRERVGIAAPTRAQVAAVLTDLRELIVSGAFTHAADEGACKFCDYTAACDEHALAHAQLKSADPKLRAYARLGAHV